MVHFALEDGKPVGLRRLCQIQRYMSVGAEMGWGLKWSIHEPGSWAVVRLEKKHIFANLPRRVPFLLFVLVAALLSRNSNLTILYNEHKENLCVYKGVHIQTRAHLHTKSRDFKN